MILLRALLALGLLIGLYLLCFTLVAVDLGFVVLLVRDSIALGKPLPGSVMMTLFTTVPALWVMRGLFVLGGSAGPDPHSLRVSGSEAPALWASVRELAEEVGTRPPAEIRLIGEVNAKVTEETSFLGLFGGTRRLYVGLPLLAGLSADELRVVLCHELGHYAHAHTRLGAITYRGQLSVRETLDRLELLRKPAVGARGPARSGGPVSWMWWPFLGYAAVYFRLCYAVNRRQELQADAVAARVVGAEIAAEALWRSLRVLPVAWGEFRTRCLDPMRARGCVPDDPFAAFAAMLADPGYRARLEELRRLPPPERTRKYDSHPSLARRLRALGRLDGPVGERDPVPAAGRFPYRGPTPQAVRRCVFPTGSAGSAALPWREWLDLTAETLATEPVRQLVRAAHRLGDPSRPALAVVLDLLGSGAGRRLAEHLPDPLAADDDPPSDGPSDGRTGGDAARRRLETALFALVGQALVTRGRARWEMSWGGPDRLVWTEAGASAAGNVTVAEFRELVGAAAAGGLAEVERLRLHLHALGVDAGAWLSQDAEGSPQSGAPVETMTVSPTEDVATREENRRKLRVAVVGGAFAIGLFLLTALPLPFDRDPVPLPGVRVDFRPGTVPSTTLPLTVPTTVPGRLWPSVAPYPSISPFPYDPGLLNPLVSDPPTDGRESGRLKRLLDGRRFGGRLLTPKDFKRVLPRKRR
ncbi:M48 family metallopeptidase [Streptosporangium sp. NPDC004631]